jgi:two-component system LytT family response regulator
MRILIVDDEPPARVRLRTMLEMLPDGDALEVVGEAEDGEAALDAIARERPDLVFLDVQMPGLDGFAVVRALAADPALLETLGGAPPAVVFATAYDQHAVRAFDVHAVDYLVKPFDGKRLATALARARERLEARRAAAGPRRAAPRTRRAARRRAAGRWRRAGVPDPDRRAARRARVLRAHGRHRLGGGRGELSAPAHRRRYPAG